MPRLPEILISLSTQYLTSEATQTLPQIPVAIPKHLCQLLISVPICHQNHTAALSDNNMVTYLRFRLHLVWSRRQRRWDCATFPLTRWYRYSCRLCWCWCHFLLSNTNLHNWHRITLPPVCLIYKYALSKTTLATKHRQHIDNKMPVTTISKHIALLNHWVQLNLALLVQLSRAS